MYGITRLGRCKIADRRNSLCQTLPFSRLDWDNWWLDFELVKNRAGDVIGRSCYLHVRSKDGETWHRVFCRRGQFARIEYIGGVAHWMFQKARG